MVAVDERQLRIDAFKDKVASIRATTRDYNISSDHSINTLDSGSCATPSVDSTSTTQNSSDKGSVDGIMKANRELLVSTAELLKATEKRSPEETTSLPTLPDDEDDDEDDEESEDERTNVSSGGVKKHYKLSPIASNDEEDSHASTNRQFDDSSRISGDTSLFEGMFKVVHKHANQQLLMTPASSSSDDEVLSGEGNSEQFVRDSKSCGGDSDLFNGMLNSVRKTLHSHDDDDSSSASSTMSQLFSEDILTPSKSKERFETGIVKTSSKMIQPVNLDEKFIGTIDRPRIVATRAISQVSKFSASTNSSSGGFSIESIANNSGATTNSGSSSSGFSIDKYVSRVNKSRVGADDQSEASYLDVIPDRDTALTSFASMVACERSETPMSGASVESTSPNTDVNGFGIVPYDDIKRVPEEAITSPSPAESQTFIGNLTLNQPDSVDERSINQVVSEEISTSSGTTGFMHFKKIFSETPTISNMAPTCYDTIESDYSLVSTSSRISNCELGLTPSQDRKLAKEEATSDNITILSDVSESQLIEHVDSVDDLSIEECGGIVDQSNKFLVVESTARVTMVNLQRGKSMTDSSVASKLHFTSRYGSLLRQEERNIAISPSLESVDRIVGKTDKIISQRLRRLVELGQEVKELEGNDSESSSSSSRRGKRERRYSTQKVDLSTASTPTDVWLADSNEEDHESSNSSYRFNDSTVDDADHASPADHVPPMSKQNVPPPPLQDTKTLPAVASNPIEELLRLRQSHKMVMETFQLAEASVAATPAENFDDKPISAIIVKHQPAPAPTPRKSDSIMVTDMLKLRQARKTDLSKKRPNKENEETSEASTATEIFSSYSVSCSTTDDHKDSVRPLCADLLRLRQTRKIAIQNMLDNSVGSVKLEDLSNTGTSMSSKSAIAEMRKKMFPLVFSDDNDSKASLDGALFCNLQRALYNIQSVENREEDGESRIDGAAHQDSDRRPANVKSQVIVTKDTESCAVSSLKDESYFLQSRQGNAHYVDREFNEDDLFVDDDDDEVISAPRCPASVGKNEDESHWSVSSVHSKASEAEHERVATRPKKAAITRDGSTTISSKDHILGTTINITNDFLASERIYLECLRAQVHAELKVHVADEEIRLALDARLHAIQDFYKRKATVISLSKTTSFPIPPSLTGNEDFLHRIGEFSKLKTVASQTSEVFSAQPLTNHEKQRTDSHLYALKRAQAKMNEAIRETHSSPRSSACFLEDVEEETISEDRVFGDIPEHILPKDTFWLDEDDPYSTLGSSPSSGSNAEIDRIPTRAEIVQHAWVFYLIINSLICDSRVYDYEFRQIQDDPLYPYLNSLVGIADSGEDGYANENKRVSQVGKAEYANMGSHRICHNLAKDAEKVVPELKAICADLGRKVGTQAIAVGPVKKPSEALLKCERKYGGNPLLVTDYCRASLFVKDVASLLALIEIVLSKYTNIVRRIKLSRLKSDHDPLVGGYRDCKINLDVSGHVCEIQLHFVPLWLIKEADGYNHYKKCYEHNVYPSSFDIGRTLVGLSRSELNDFVTISEHDLDVTPIESLKDYHEEKIREYFALANLYLRHSMGAKAEFILRRTAKLRSESSSFGRFHAETLLHLELLHKSLKLQHKFKSALAVQSQINKITKMQRQGKGDDQEPTVSKLCATNQCAAFERVVDMIIDPAKTERQNEMRKIAEVEESRALWLRQRREHFPAMSQSVSQSRDDSENLQSV